MSSDLAVLVADDELGMRETLVEIFADSGYAVRSVADGDSALVEIRRNRFDVVVMDIRMPGRDGVAVLLESGAPPPPVILMTAYANDDQVREAQASAFALLSKPFEVRHLLRLVADAAGVAA